MFWFRMLLVLVLLSPSVGWCLEPEDDDDLGILIQKLSSNDTTAHTQALTHLYASKSTLPALPALLQVARESNRKNRITALYKIAQFGRWGKTALPVLRQMLTDPDLEVRGLSAAALLSIEPRDAAGIAVLSHLLRNGNPESRLDVTRLVVDILKLKAHGIAPALIAIIDDPDETIRRQVVQALSVIGSDDQGLARIALRRKLNDASPSVRVQAAESLWNLDEPADSLVPVLTEIVKAAKPEAPARSEDSVATYTESPERLAIDLLGSIGPESKSALPTLIGMVKGPRIDLRITAVHALGEMGPEAEPAIEVLSQTFSETQQHPVHLYHTFSVADEAVIALYRIGTASRAAILTAAESNNYYVERRAIIVLGLLPDSDPQTIAVLIRSLSNKRKDIQVNAALGLGQIGRSAMAAVPELTSKVCDETRDGYLDDGETFSCFVGDYMYAALMKIQNRPETVLPVIINTLKKEKRINDAMLKLLGTLGPQARPTVSEIELLLEVPEQRLNAAVALARITPENPKLLPIFQSHLTDPEGSGYWGAIRGVGILGPRAISALPVLISELERTNDNDDVKPVLAAAIVKIDRQRTKAIIDLAVGLQRCVVRVGNEYEEEFAAWSELGAESRPAWEPLISGLNYQSPEPRKDYFWKGYRDCETRRRSAELLFRVSPRTPEIVDGLIDLCRFASRDGGRAADLIAKIGPPAVKAAPVLVSLFADRSPYIISGDSYSAVHFYARDRALIALGKLGPAAIPALQEGLTDLDPLTREYSALALGLIGPSASTAIGNLTACLKDQHRKVRAATALALGKIGDKSESTVTALRRALSDPHLSVRLAAVSALGQLGPSARDALPDIARLQKEGYKSIQKAASEAIRKIEMR